VKQLHGNSLILGVAAVTFLAAQPVWAQVTQVNDVKLNPVDGGISVVLKTSSGARPQVFTTKRGKTLVSDIINAQLRLRQGNSFRQENPAPGIASVEVAQLDANSIRVIVTGSNDAPGSQPVTRQDDKITLGFTPSGGTTASAPTPTQPAAPSVNVPVQPSQKPDVLVPNPQISIEGKPAQAAGPGQPASQAPPFLPRAVAPPVGDISVSTTDASPTNIDLGTQERVPRLVLRDAPVREVLSLLARAANLNLAYISGDASGGQQGAANGQATSQTISLDIENEPVQDVFNYVLRLSGLEANRNGRTVFVGPKLPNSTRDTVVRSLRLNQVTADTALSFLVGLGAESAVTRERLVTSVNAVPVGGAANTAVTQTQTTTELQIETLRTEFVDSKPLLRGLQAIGDTRTNSVTLVGTQKLIDIAIGQLTQLDVRRRQVAINVKIIDVNLLNTQNNNTSFSFGVGNNFFVNDGGAASFNFGGSRPATAGEAASSVTTTPVITNPIEGETFIGDKFFNPAPGSRPSADPSLSKNPLQPGITDFTPGTPPTGTSPGTPDRYTFSLPTLYQFPKRFLASLQAQVTSGNAKILTDPTLTVQEGQNAVVKLTAQVYGGIEVTSGSSSTSSSSAGAFTRKPIIKDAGLTLAVKVERIDDNGFVSLSVAPTISAPNGSVPTPGDGDITLLSERSLASGLIRLRDGQTLILSGIIQDADRVSVSKIPILGDIPLLGSLFRRTNKTNQRNEVIVLLTPQVMDDSENSSYGYNYTPSPEVRQMLERRGLSVPKR
jgi:type IV pilus assembly protein PilQ